jgi:hypothetical protein
MERAMSKVSGALLAPWQTLASLAMIDTRLSQAAGDVRNRARVVCRSRDGTPLVARPWRRDIAGEHVVTVRTAEAVDSSHRLSATYAPSYQPMSR